MTFGFIAYGLGASAATAVAVGGVGASVISSKQGSDAAKKAARTQAGSVSEGIEETRRAAEQGLEFLEPFADVGQTGIEQAGFLTDPQAQFQFLQENPLFQLSLDEANLQTKNLAAARGRLSAGDTLQQLSENVLLSASPLITQQKQSIGDLLNLGSGTARAQANTAIGAGSDITNLITSRGDVLAAGTIGQANAQSQGVENILSSLILAGGQK